jgi:hypothetical protein
VKNPLTGYPGANGDITGILPHAAKWGYKKMEAEKKTQEEVEDEKKITIEELQEYWLMYECQREGGTF